MPVIYSNTYHHDDNTKTARVKTWNWAVNKKVKQNKNLAKQIKWKNSVNSKNHNNLFKPKLTKVGAKNFMNSDNVREQ